MADENQVFESVNRTYKGIGYVLQWYAEGWGWTLKDGTTTTLRATAQGSAECDVRTYIRNKILK